MKVKSKEEVVAEIISMMTDEDKEVRKVKKEDLIQHHHGWGMGIRNYYDLHRDKGLVESILGKPGHADDASMVIMKAVWEALQDQ